MTYARCVGFIKYPLERNNSYYKLKFYFFCYYNKHESEAPMFFKKNIFRTYEKIFGCQEKKCKNSNMLDYFYSLFVSFNKYVQLNADFPTY